jgi:hypothetical protein
MMSDQLPERKATSGCCANCLPCSHVFAPTALDLLQPVSSCENSRVLLYFPSGCSSPSLLCSCSCSDSVTNRQGGKQKELQTLCQRGWVEDLTFPSLDMTKASDEVGGKFETALSPIISVRVH